MVNSPWPLKPPRRKPMAFDRRVKPRPFRSRTDAIVDWIIGGTIGVLIGMMLVLSTVLPGP